MSIVPSKGPPTLNFGELFQYRELLYLIVGRDSKVCKEQTVLGATWAIIQPFMTMVVFSLLFGRLADVLSEGVPLSHLQLCGVGPADVLC